MMDDHTDHGLALLQEEAATVKSPAASPIQPPPSEEASAATSEVLPINLSFQPENLLWGDQAGGSGHQARPAANPGEAKAENRRFCKTRKSSGEKKKEDDEGSAGEPSVAADPAAPSSPVHAMSQPRSTLPWRTWGKRDQFSRVG